MTLIERLRSRAWEHRQHRHLRELAATRIEQLEAALTKVHGIVAEYWGPCMGSVEVLLTCREAIGESAKNWGPRLTSETAAKPTQYTAKMASSEPLPCENCGRGVDAHVGLGMPCPPPKTKGDDNGSV